MRSATWVLFTFLQIDDAVCERVFHTDHVGFVYIFFKTRLSGILQYDAAFLHHASRITWAKLPTLSMTFLLFF